jgi:hypothetical protein
LIVPAYIILPLACEEQKRQNAARVKYWEIIGDNLSKAGWSWGCLSAVDCDGRTIWIVDAHRDNEKRFVARADEKLTAFVELESAIRAASVELHFLTKPVLATQFAPQGNQAERSESEQR